MLSMGRLFNRKHNHYSAAPLTRRRRWTHLLPWVTGSAIAFSVPAIMYAQHSPSNASAPKAAANVDISTPGVNLHKQSASQSSDSKASAKIEVQTNQSTGSSDTSPNVSTHVTVNGKSIKVPVNGSIHTSVPSNSGTSHVNISVNNSSNGSTNNDSSSSTDVNVHSSANSFVYQEDSE